MRPERSATHLDGLLGHALAREVNVEAQALLDEALAARHVGEQVTQVPVQGERGWAAGQHAEWMRWGMGALPAWALMALPTSPPAGGGGRQPRAPLPMHAKSSHRVLEAAVSTHVWSISLTWACRSFHALVSAMEVAMFLASSCKDQT